MNLIFHFKHLFLWCFLIKIYIFQPNDPEKNIICFSNDDFIFVNNENNDIESLCLQKGGYLKKGLRDNSIYREAYKLENKTYCCKISCGINGTIIGDHCKWIEDKSFCELTSNLYYIKPITISGTIYCYNLLVDIFNLFNFNVHYQCTFKSKEDLLINFAEQIHGKFKYSLGGGHNHFDKRLMDTSKGKGSMESPFLIYPTFGINLGKKLTRN